MHLIVLLLHDVSNLQIQISFLPANPKYHSKTQNFLRNKQIIMHLVVMSTNKQHILAKTTNNKVKRVP
jgi:hypothetical protein